MLIDLSKITFVNDFFTTMTPDGSLLVLNKIDEALKHEEEEEQIKAINIELQTTEEAIICPCVIGLGNDYLQIKTNYKEYEGEVLTPENMVYCTIEVYDR